MTPGLLFGRVMVLHFGFIFVVVNLSHPQSTIKGHQGFKKKLSLIHIHHGVMDMNETIPYGVGN
jgi:hypothetical protein